MAMTTEELAKRIKEKAGQEVSRKIQRICMEIKSLLDQQGIYTGPYETKFGDKGCALLKAIAENDGPYGNNYPRFLWDTEEAKLAEKVLGQFDVVQQLLHVDLNKQPSDKQATPAKARDQ